MGCVVPCKGRGEALYQCPQILLKKTHDTKKSPYVRPSIDAHHHSKEEEEIVKERKKKAHARADGNGKVRRRRKTRKIYIKR